MTVTVEQTSPTAEEITWDRGDAGLTHTRNLGAGLHTITATVKDGTSTRIHTIRVTRTDTPGALRSLRASTARNVGREVTLSWSAQLDDGKAPIDYYEVAYYDELDLEVDVDGQLTDAELDGLEDDAKGWESVGDVLSRRVTGLYNGRTYYFRVRAHNINGVGNGSNEASATPAGPPVAPEPFNVEPGNARVELTWFNPEDDPDHPGYPSRNPIGSYEYSQDGTWRSIPNSDASTRSHTVTGLTNGTTYEFRVAARNGAGRGDPSERLSKVPISGVPGAPTGLTAQAGDEEVTLSWRAPTNKGGERITRYEYKQEATSGGIAGTWTTTGGTGTTVTVQGLINRMTYYFKVRAVNDLGCPANGPSGTEGCGQESVEESAEPFGTPVTRVRLTGAESDQDGRVLLTWDPEMDQEPPPPTTTLAGSSTGRCQAAVGDGSTFATATR